jgi:hypothetical protein
MFDEAWRLVAAIEHLRIEGDTGGHYICWRRDLVAGGWTILDDHRQDYRRNLNAGLQHYTVLLFERLPRRSTIPAAPAHIAAATNDIDAVADNAHRMMGMPPSRHMPVRSAAANGISFGFKNSFHH